MNENSIIINTQEYINTFNTKYSPQYSKQKCIIHLYSLLFQGTLKIYILVLKNDPVYCPAVTCTGFIAVYFLCFAVYFLYFVEWVKFRSFQFF